mmetsp:Transcript_15281/g.35973  ORF Transcript_15281/g.35973 Transcript_15281/m.35973 type:complete len:329 (-) Transcript_15281:302-1288(-)
MVALLLLHLLQELGVDHALRLHLLLETLREATLHALEAAHVDVRFGILDQLPQILAVLHHLVLHPHLSVDFVLLRLLFAGNCVVVAELAWELGLHLLPLFVIEQGLAVGNSQEQPGTALELALRDLVVEEVAQVGSEWCDTGSGGHEDHVRLGIFRQQHLGSCRASDKNVISRFQIADVAGANSAIDLLCVRELKILSLFDVRVLAPATSGHLHNALHHQGHGLAALVVTGRGRCDGVQADLCWGLALLVRARRNHADGLALDVRHLASVVHDHMARLPVHQRGLAGDGLLGHAAALVWCLGAEEVPGDLLALNHADTLLLHSSSAAT